MSSDAQIVANRLNAQKSTGPRTAEGKAVVSQNAVKHGLLARQAVIVGEDPGEFAVYREQILAELVPVGEMESVLAERVVGLSWRLRRAERLQNEAFDALYEKETTGPLARLSQSLQSRGADRAQRDPDAGEDDPELGRVVVKDFGHARVLDRLLMYERRIEHSLYRTMAELQRLRLLREPARRAEEPTAKAAAPGGDDPSCERPPVSAGRSAAIPALRETLACSVGGPQSTGPVRREPGADRGKQSQFARAQMKDNCCAAKSLGQERRIAGPGKQSQWATGRGWEGSENMGTSPAEPSFDVRLPRGNGSPPAVSEFCMAGGNVGRQV